LNREDEKSACRGLWRNLAYYFRAPAARANFGRETIPDRSALEAQSRASETQIK
jgi:hypothetical protein